MQIEAIYVNALEHLKRETFRLRIDAIDALAGTYALGSSSNTILKIHDVLGTGSAALSGDIDFVDTYPTAWETVSYNILLQRFTVLIRMATLSLDVPYRNQNAGSETLRNMTTQFSGSILCMPTSTEMLFAYWGVTDSTGAAVTRNDVMQGTYDASATQTTTVFPRPWQRWGELRSWTGGILGASLNVASEIPGAKNGESVPSDTADAMRDQLVVGQPMIVSIEGGHIILVRGAVVDHLNAVRWLICNDPYGNLASSDSSYGLLNLGASVGNGAVNNVPDVSAVQDVLRSTGHYGGEVDGVANAATIDAIRRFQGAQGDGIIEPGGTTEALLNQRIQARDNPWYSSAENEKNDATGADSTHGMHVYYSSATESKGGHLQFKAKTNSMVLHHAPPLTRVEVAARLTVGAPPPG